MAAKTEVGVSAPSEAEIGRYLRPAGLKFSGFLALMGWVLVAVATALHPREAAFGSGTQALRDITGNPRWIPIHLLLALGFTLLVPAFSHFESRLAYRGTPARTHALSRLGAQLFRASLPLWLMVASWEIAILTAMASAPGTVIDVSPLWVALVRGLRNFSLLLGYVAAFLMWGTLVSWGVAGRITGSLSRPFSIWAVVGGILGWVGLPLGALVSARWGVWALAATSAVGAIWIPVAAWSMFVGESEPS